MIKNCLKCGKNLTGNKKEVPRDNPEYCCENCRCLARYYRVKNEPHEKRRRYLTSRKWRLEHRERYNALILPKAKAYIMKRYYMRKAKRLCVYCGVRLRSKDKTRCPACCMKESKRQKKYYKKGKP